MSIGDLRTSRRTSRGIKFKEQESGYLAGYLAGLWRRASRGRRQVNTISSVGGQKIPPVDHYIAGYQRGREEGRPGHQGR